MAAGDWYGGGSGMRSGLRGLVSAIGHKRVIRLEGHVRLQTYDRAMLV